MENWNKKLYTAAGDGDIETLKLCLENGADIDYQSGGGWTALMEAAGGGHLEICRLLIDRGCKIDTTNGYGWTALMWAAVVGHLEICRILIDRGCKIDITSDYGQTALMFAAERGHLEICRLLIDTGCKIDITNSDGYTALHLAANWGHLQTTRYLVERGAVSPLVTTHEGKTPYDLAAAEQEGQYKEVMEYLQSVMSEESPGVTAGQGMEVPIEIQLMADKRSVPLYLELLESGYEIKRDIRLVIVGKKGAGKTSFVNRLFNEGNIVASRTSLGDDKKSIKSTNGIEIHTIKCPVNSDDGRWNKLDGNCTETELVARILKPYDEKLTRKDTASIEAADRKTIKENPAATNVDKSKESKTKSKQPQKDEVPDDSQGKPPSHAKLPETTKYQHTFPVTIGPQVELPLATGADDPLFKQAYDEMKVMLKSKIDLNDKKEYATILLWDFAGDKEFYHTHQTFLSSDAIYLVFTKLNEADDPTAQDMFKLWMNSIHWYCRFEDQHGKPEKYPTDPPVILIGSHTDEVNYSENADDVHDVYRNCINKFTEHVSEEANRHIRKEYYISNTKDKDDKFLKIKRELLLQAEKGRMWETKYPLKFVHLEKRLQEQKTKPHIPIISMQNIREISTKLPYPLSPEELTLFLGYHHEIRSLVYFEDLPDFIVLDTQWLSDAFKCIITAEQFQVVPSRHGMKEKLKDFNERGILHSEVLNEMFNNENNILHKHLEHKKEILNVMEKFDIIIPKNEKSCYYVPCMVNSKLEDDIYEIFNVTKKSTWLFYRFDFLPPHLINHLIASLCRKYEVAEYCAKSEKTEWKIALFKGSVVVNLENVRKTQKLYVRLCQGCIQIQVWRFENDKDALPQSSFYKIIDKFVTEEITKIVSRTCRRSKTSSANYNKFSELECGFQKRVSFTETNDLSREQYCPSCQKAHDITDEWSYLQSETQREEQDVPKCSDSTTDNRTEQHKVDFSDILDQMMTRLVISVDDRRCIERNDEQYVRQEEKEHKLLDIVLKRGEPNRTVCIEVLQEKNGYKDLAMKLKSASLKTTSTENTVHDVPDYKVRLQKNYLEIIKTIKHNNQ